MRTFVGITDWDWFELLRSQPGLDEVNFWQPSGTRRFRALNPGELFLFKLHSPRNYIVGGGLFAHSSLLPISLAWEAFGIANGAVDFTQMRARVERYRRQGHEQFTDYTVGCILLEQPFFLNENQWIPVPGDWSPNIVQGRGYDLTAEPGLTLWAHLQTANRHSYGGAGRWCTLRASDFVVPEAWPGILSHHCHGCLRPAVCGNE